MEPHYQPDLQENDLLTFLTNFKTWWNKHGTKVLLVVLVVVGSWWAKRYVDQRRHEQREQYWGDLAQAQSAEICRVLAESYDNPAFQARAFLTGGDLILAQVKAGGQDEAALTNLLQDAASMYERALAVPKAATVYRLNAWLGLAAIAEERGDWPSAADLYNRIRAEAGDRYVIIARLAQGRLDMLPRLAQKVTFAPSPTPVPIPASDAGSIPAASEAAPLPPVLDLPPAPPVTP